MTGRASYFFSEFLALYNEFSATDILLGPGDLCSHVILVQRSQLDVHAFCHSRSPQEPYSGCGHGCFQFNREGGFSIL
jgi:hypothetical protein